MQFLDTSPTPHPPSRAVAPPPEMSNEKKEQLYSRQTGQIPPQIRPLAEGTPLEIVFKGRFDK
jgi:hypothetical protein